MRERLSILALALFVAVDIVLIALAVRHVQSPPQAADPPASSQSSTAAPSATPASSGSASPQADSSTTSADASPNAQPVDFLTVADPKVFVRASRGRCSTEPAQVSISTDSGRSFDAVEVTGLGEVLGLRATSASELTVIGLGTRCKPARFSSSDGGQSWSRIPGGGPTWHLSPDPKATTVTTPAGRRPTPCTPTAVSTVNEGIVRVLCADGRILGTQDVGQTWILLGTLTGAQDIAFATPGDGLAVAGQDGCASALMRSADGGGSWSKVSCLKGKPPLAIGSQDQVVAVQVGDKVRVSTDGGTTWRS